MYIKKLELLNFQVIKEFNADFEGNVYFITGDNELGKSTLLKAIGAMLTGNRDAVLKNGEDKGFAKMVVGNDGENYEVELKFTKANPRGTLSIKSQTTGMRSDNVSMLQKTCAPSDLIRSEQSRSLRPNEEMQLSDLGFCYFAMANEFWGLESARINFLVS